MFRQSLRAVVPSMKASFSGSRLLSTVRYAKSHEYIKVDGNVGIVGITKHAADALGDVVYVGLPSVGSSFSAGASFGSVESVKAASDVYAPVSGEVVEVNQELEANPAKINESPLDAGWIIKLKLNDASKNDLNKLLDEAGYNKHLESEAH